MLGLLYWLWFLILPLLLLFSVFFVGAGLLLFVKPKGIRPPWWDWGMDEPITTTEKQPEIKELPEKEAPPVAVPQIVIKPSRPRW
jgi:hypothetical protein